MPGSGQANRAELADVRRLARRLLNRAVETARNEDQPLRRLLLEHLGPDAALLPTVSATWPSYEHVNVQVALDAWLADAHLATALDQLLDNRNQLTRVLLGGEQA